MKLGAEPRKVAILVGLLGVAGYLFISNFGSSPTPAARPTSTPSPPAPTSGAPATRTAPSVRRLPETPNRITERAGAAARTGSAGARRTSQRTLQEFVPSLKVPEDQQIDPMSLDPTLRLDLLAKVQSVKLEGGERNLFQFGAAPLPKTLEPKIIPGAKPGANSDAKPAETAKPAVPAKPPPPPIPLKYYGFATPGQPGPRRAFFLDGDEIVVASEGELIKKRYKVVRIGVNSVVVEDTQHSNEQTLRIVDQVG